MTKEPGKKNIYWETAYFLNIYFYHFFIFKKNEKKNVIYFRKRLKRKKKMSLKKNDSFFKRKKLSNLFSFYPMPNYIYSILRVFGEKEERQKFIEYTSKIVPSQYKLTHPLNPNEKIPAMMDKWYEYQTWENEKRYFYDFFYTKCYN